MVRCPIRFYREYSFPKQRTDEKSLQKLNCTEHFASYYEQHNSEVNECWIPTLVTMHSVVLQFCYETGISAWTATAFARLVIRLVSMGLLRFGIEKLYQVAGAQNLERLLKENPVRAVTPFNSQLSQLLPMATKTTSLCKQTSHTVVYRFGFIRNDNDGHEKNCQDAKAISSA